MRLGPLLALVLLAAGVSAVQSDRPPSRSGGPAGPEPGPLAAARLGAPRLDGGRMVWEAGDTRLSPDLTPWAAALDPASATDSSRAAAWRALVLQPRWQLYGLRRLARLHLALGDSAGADSCLEALGGRRGVWQWAGLADGVSLALARGDTAGALRRVRDTEGSDWPDDERAQWLALLATLEAATGDTAAAIEHGRQAFRRFPAVPATARLLTRWDEWMSARRERPGPGDLRSAAEVDFYRPDRAAAARRLEAALPGLERPERAVAGRRLGEILRLSRRYTEAIRVLNRAARDADEQAERARNALERARVERDAGDADRAGKWYSRAAELATGPAIRDLAYWERARELEQLGAWRRARDDYRRTVEVGLGHADEASLRAGLLWYVDGEPDSARAAWSRSSSEASEFWTGVSQRRAGYSAADTVLAAIAARPGYTFYRTAARDTLGCPGRPEGLEPAAAADEGDETLALARDLIALGEAQDAALLLQRWYGGDRRLQSHSRTPGRLPGELLCAAQLVHAAGRTALGIQFARRALEAHPESAVTERWRVIPWAYPPAFDSLVSAAAATEDGVKLERELLFALIWQESKFDPLARSRSGAIGLMQLKPSVANTMARRRREYPLPHESGLMDPAINIRYGTRLLGVLSGTFDGEITLMLAGYNAGPSSALKWRRPEVVGGDALEAELFQYAETEDYVKAILGARQAYRELSPRAGGAEGAAGPPAAGRPER